MPGGNGNGPAGMGPRTGLGRGACATAGQAFVGRGLGRAGGRGGRGPRGRFPEVESSDLTKFDPKEERALLRARAEYLAGEIEAVRSRLNELEQKEK